jgi:hypothetical protein
MMVPATYVVPFSRQRLDIPAVVLVSNRPATPPVAAPAAPADSPTHVLGVETLLQLAESGNCTERRMRSILDCLFIFRF